MTHYAFMSIAYGGEGDFLMLLKDYLPAVTQCSEDSILRLARRFPTRWGFAPLADLLQLDQSQRILDVIPKN